MVTLTQFRAIQRQMIGTRDGFMCWYCKLPAEEGPLVVHHVNGNDRDERPENTKLACKRCQQKEYWNTLRGKAQLQGPRRPAELDALDADKQMRHERQKNQPPLSNFLESDQSTRQAESEREKAIPKETMKEVVEGLKHIHKVSPIKRRDTTNTPSSVSVSEPSAEVAARVDRALGVDREPPEMRVARDKKPEFVAEVMRRMYSRDDVVDPVTVDEVQYGVSYYIGVSDVAAHRWLKQLLSKDGPLELGQGRRGFQVVRFKDDFLKELA